MKADRAMAVADLVAVSADACYQSQPVYFIKYDGYRVAVEANWKIRLQTKNTGDITSQPAWVSLGTGLTTSYHNQVTSLNLTNPMIPSLKPGQSTITIWYKKAILDRDYPWKSLFIFPDRMNETNVNNNKIYIKDWTRRCP